jgi:transposase InsO family protein
VLISPQQLQRDLAFWIEGDYNRERRHSTSGYLSSILEQIHHFAWLASA